MSNRYVYSKLRREEPGISCSWPPVKGFAGEAFGNTPHAEGVLFDG